MKRRILSIITALALCLSLCPTWAFATEADPSLCKHHPEHTEDCGYIAPTEGHDCGHQHTAACYTLGVLPDADSGDPYQVGGDTENLLDCQHSHNSECGYVQADPGTPCGYVCRICPIEDLIAALPEQVTEDNADDVRAQLDKILALYRELDEGEQEEIDLSRCYELQEALDNANAPMQAAGEINISQNRQNILTEEDGGCQGHTFTGTAQATMIYVESGAHDVTFADLNITASAMVGVAPGATMNLTIAGTNTIKAGGYAGIYVPENATLVITAGSIGSLDVSSETDAGIGGGAYNPIDTSGYTSGDPNCGTVEINGGTITATGGSCCAGIGGGITDDVPGNGGDITINGGTVTATGGSDNYYGGAGIGGAGGVLNKWSELVSGSGGTLTINGGHVTLTAGTHDPQYPTYGFGQGSGEAPTGTYELTLVDASYLDTSTTLDPKGKYTINGDPTADMIVVPELVYTGEALDTSGIKIDDTKTGTGTYFNQTFTVNASADGWVLQDLGEVVNAGTYTATFKKGDKEISKTFTVAKSGTDLTSEGKVKTYNGETATDSFTASDIITVKATPTATGTAPQKAAARLRGSYTAPTAGQMALFVGDIQVCEPVEAGADGTYTMTVSAADVLLAAGGPKTGITLTAKFVENDNMADGTGTATVNITAVAKAERDGKVIGYYGESNLDDAFDKESGNDGATFTLLTNVERIYSLDIYINCTLDLNGHTITTGDNLCVSIQENTAVTIRGEGEIISKSIALAVYGSVTLEGGTYTSTGSEDFSHGVDVGQSATLSVIGEKVTIRSTGGSSGLNIDDAQSVQLSAGTYSGAKAIESIVKLSDMLVHTDNTRYAFFQNGIPVTKASAWVDGNISDVPLDTPIAWLTGTVTVRECGHTGEGVCTYTHNENTSTHTKTCLACGKTWDAEDCAYTFSGGTGTCAACGDSVTVTVSGTDGLIYDGTEKEPGVTVMRGETALTAGTDYTVAYTDNKNAGENKATVTVTIGNGQGSYIQNFSISKASLTIKANDQAITYGGNIATGTDQVTPTGLVGGDTLESVTLEASSDQVAVADKTITPSAAVIKRGGEDVTANYNITYQPGALIINKSQPTIAFDNGYNPGKTYDGQTIPDPTADDLTITGANFSDVTFEWSATPKDAGTYTLTANIKETPNTAAASTSPLTVTINKATLTATGATVASKTYDTTKTATVSGVTFTGLVNGETLALGTDYTASGEFDSENAGTGKSVTVTVTLTSDKAKNYSLAQNTTTATSDITKASSTITTAPIASGITYGQALSDSALTGGGAVSGDTTLTGAWNWTAPDTKPSAGTAQFSVTFTPDDPNYNTATVNVSVAVAKATPAITWASAAQTVDYTGSEAAITPPTVSLVNGESFRDAISYSYAPSGSTEYTSGLPVNAGTYTVKASIAEQDNYTTAESETMTLTISKINYTGTITASTSGKYGREKTYDLSDLLPDGYKLGTPAKTDTDNIFDGDPIVNGTALTYKLVNDSQKVDSTGTITVPVTESTNYNQFDLTITVTVTDKIVPTLTVTPISVSYTGSAVPSDAIHGTAMADGKNIPGSWSFADGQALTNVADSGTKTVNFTPADEFKDDYAPATGTVRVTITKATPSLSLTPSPATLPNGGTVTLALSGLPSGGSATVTCSDANITVTKGSGNTWTANLPAGGASYTFTASYAGDGNHNGASANCTVSVEKITPTLSLTANPASLRGGGTVTLTLSGLPAGGTATVTCSGGITVTAGAGNTWTATLPNNTATYTFTASYAGNASYNAASASCTVEAIEVTVLPNPPAAEDGKQYQVVMEDGISEVPAGLQSIETLNTPEKLETAMKTAITQANSGVPQDNTAVYDVELQISDNGGATWTKATAANFPANGLTVTLPYPAGTNSGYTFTVVHMFTTSDFGKTPGHTETPTVTNTADGLRFTVTGLSPISVGWVQPSTPTTPTGPTGGGGGGGGWSSSTYAVTVERAEHGKVTSNRTNASSGSTVTLTVTPDTGYVLDTLTVTDSRGSEIKLTAQGGGKYTFTMPGRAVTVKAAFAPLPDDTEKPCDGGVDCPSHGFTDLGTVGTWYHEAVDYVLRNNLMGGYGNGLFGPNDTLTRAQFAQILYNKEGRPAVTGGGIFTDVAPVAWCAPAITWAAERGIVGGYGNGAFGPNDNITREQLAVMLWRYAGSPAATDKELHFNDADKASGYALEALRWAVENGVMSGKGGGILDPKGLATRAQTAQMLKNFLKDD